MSSLSLINDNSTEIKLNIHKKNNAVIDSEKIFS